jgi:hypothetical protein
MPIKILMLGLLNIRPAEESNNLQLTSIPTRLSGPHTRILSSTTTGTSTGWRWSITDIAVRICHLRYSYADGDSCPVLICFLRFFKTAAYNLPAYYPKKKTPHITGGGMDGIYQFAQIHLHWGSDSTKGSEHLVNSKRYTSFTNG